ncbi:unknown [Prevotella sp. CAG:487]|nr:unknown [Prevotella sp. CAG:487]
MSHNYSVMSTQSFCVMKINKVLFQIIMLFVVSCSVSEVAGNVIFTSITVMP